MQPSNQDVCKGSVEIFGGANELVVDVTSGAAAANGIEEMIDSAEVAGAEGGGVAGEFSGIFESLEAERTGIAEFEFFVVEDLQDEDVMAALSERLQAAKEIVAAAEQV